MIFALDIGGSFIKSGLMDGDGKLYIFPQIPSCADGSVDDIASALHKAFAVVNTPITGIGVSIPGPFDYEAGISLMKHKFPSLYQVNLRSMFPPNVPIRFIHDANAFLLGEIAYGKGRNLSRVGAITLGTGIGAAFAEHGICRNQPLGSPAKEVSLWNQSFRGRTVEDFISARSMLERYPAHNVQYIEEQAYAGDRAARQAWRDFGQTLCEVLTPWCRKFDMERIILGGQMSKAFALFSDQLISLPVVRGELAEAALYGAAAAAMI